MNELEKLKKLLEHWKEHNQEHARVYGEWAEKALGFGREDLSEILHTLSTETKKLNSLFEEAVEKTVNV